MKKKGRNQGIFRVIAVVFLVLLIGSLFPPHITLADKDHSDNNANDNSAKTFWIQDGSNFQGKNGGNDNGNDDENDRGNNGFISNNHLVNQTFPVYIFITNGGQTQNVGAPQNTTVKATLISKDDDDKAFDLGTITISKGQNYGTINVSCPWAGSWVVQVEGDPGKGDVTVQSNIFTVGSQQNGTVLQISPAMATVDLKTSSQQQFTATYVFYIFNQQFSLPVTYLATWSSSNTNVATVQNGLSGGLTTALAPGTATITASLGWPFSVNGSAQLTVINTKLPPTPVSLTVSPSSDSAPAGQSKQFKAILNYSDNSHQDVTTSAAWSSSDTSLATVGTVGQGTPGLATGVAPGTAIITAAYNGFNGQATFNVGQPVPTGLTVSPLTASGPVGLSQQFTATLNFSDNTHQDVTTSATWSSDNTSLATVGTGGQGTPGLATGVAEGTVTITAIYQDFYGEATFKVVQPYPVSLIVSPTAASVTVGQTQQFSATLYYSDNSMKDVTTSATWSSDQQSVATVNANGLATGIAQGTATITATANGFNAQATLTVKVPVSLTITPGGSTIPIGGTQKFTAILLYSDNSQQDVSTSATWSSSNPAVATVDTAGTVSGIATGPVTLSASFNGYNAQATLTVVNSPPQQGGSGGPLWETELPPQ